MSVKEILREIEAMPTDQRWKVLEGVRRLVESEVPVSCEIIAELDRRMEHFRQHPDEFTTWEAVKGRILGSRP